MTVTENPNKRAKDMIAELMNRHYAEAMAAKKRGERVGWAASNFPQEIPEALGLTVVYPENHAAAVSAKKSSLPLLEYAEGRGYSNDLCGYAKLNLAYMDVKQCAALDIPQPDYVLCCNNICSQMVKWYENLAKELNVPIIMFDVPYNVKFEVTPERIDYIKTQIMSVFHQLEELTGKKYDEQHFQEVMRISSASGRAWQRAEKAMAAMPSPVNGYDFFNYMAIVVCWKGKQETLEALTCLADELEQKVREKQSSFKGEEHFRILLEGIACWPHIGFTYKTLLKYGINVVGSNYFTAFEKVYGNLDEMAEAYATMTNCVNLEREVAMRETIIKDNHVDGMLVHLNRSCKMWNGFLYEIVRRIQKDMGIPASFFDGDQADPRAFNEAQYETRVQGLYEVMKARKDEEGDMRHE
ncbi:MAG: 2-hydroxyacyl-CoA dehydratase family protein [Sporolactobacillus sp.]